MKVSLLKISRKQEVVKRIELAEMAEMICNNPEESRVFNLRLNYQFYKPVRQGDGQIMVDSERFISLPRICFAVEFDKYKGKSRLLAYNGLVVVEVNGLKSYEEAVGIRNQVARMAFVSSPARNSMAARVLGSKVFAKRCLVMVSVSFLFL